MKKIISLIALSVLFWSGCSVLDRQYEEILGNLDVLRESWQTDRNKATRYVMTVVNGLYDDSRYRGECVVNRACELFVSLPATSYVHFVREAFLHKERLFKAIMSVLGDDDRHAEKRRRLCMSFLAEIRAQIPTENKESACPAKGRTVMDARSRLGSDMEMTVALRVDEKQDARYFRSLLEYWTRYVEDELGIVVQ